MALVLKWTATALSDVENAFEFITAANLKAAKAFIGTILQAIDRLLIFPETGRTGRVKNTRELFVSGTPYVIVYRHVPGAIQLVAVLHAARKWP
jgi:toxin ParE1/3/4